MLDRNNVLAKAFRVANVRFLDENFRNVKLRLINKRDFDGKRYNFPTISKVVALIIGDIGDLGAKRDIIIKTQIGLFKHISELHPAYLALQYSLLFTYGEDGYRDEIQHRD